MSLFRSSWRCSVAAATLAAAIGLAAGQAQAAPAFGPLPVPFDAGAGLVPGLFPESPPPGANDWGCKPSAAHPNPVVLVHGTLFNQGAAWQAGAPFLKNNGYCVFTFNYGTPWFMSEVPTQGVDDVRRSAVEKLAPFVDRVLGATGSAKVDLVGWSQGGGILSHFYINLLGGANKVDKLIGIAPSNHGTTLSNGVFLRSFVPPVGWAFYGALGWLFPGLSQQTFNSDVVNLVYGGGDTRPGVSYTTIVSRYDEVVTPYDQQFLQGGNVTNILVQNGCSLDLSNHMSIPYSERAWRYVLNALSPSTAEPVPCFVVSPFFPNVR